MDFQDQTNDGYPGYEVDYERDEYPSDYFPTSGRGQQHRQPPSTNATNNNNNMLTHVDHTMLLARHEALKRTTEGAESNYQSLKPPSNLLQTEYSKVPPQDFSSPIIVSQQPKEKTGQAFHHQSSPQQHPPQIKHPQHKSQLTSGLSNPINRRASAASSNRSYQVKEEEHSQPLLYGSSWLESSGSSLYPRKPKPVVWTDSSEDLLDYYDEPDHNVDDQYGESGLIGEAIHHHPPVILKPSSALPDEPDGLTNAAPANQRMRNRESGILPDHYLSDGSSRAGSSYRKTGKATPVLGESDSEQEKKPSAMTPLKTAPQQLGIHGNMRTATNISTGSDARLMQPRVTDDMTAATTGLPPRMPPIPAQSLRGTSKISNPSSESEKTHSPPNPAAATEPPLPTDHLKMIPGSFVSNNMNNLTATDFLTPLAEPSPVNQSRPSISQKPLMTPFMPNLDVAEPEPLPGTMAMVPLKGGDFVANDHQLPTVAPNGVSYEADMPAEGQLRPGTITYVSNTSNSRIASKILASMNHPPMGTTTLAATTTVNTADAAVPAEEPPRPGTITAVSNSTNNRVASKIRASMSHRPMGTASAAATASDSDVPAEEPPRPGTVTTVIANSTNDRVASKIRASMNQRSTASASAAATASDSDTGAEEPPRPGTVTSVANNSSTDRVANKIRASYNLRPTAVTAFTSESDVPVEEPSRPGTVTAVAHGSNDRVANKIRTSTINLRSVATASNAATGFSSDSDIAPLEPNRPGTVTSVKNNSNDRVASKIRASMPIRPVAAASMPFDTGITLEEPPQPGTVTYSSNDRVARKIRANDATSRPVTIMPFDSDVTAEEPSRPGTVVSVAANNPNDRVARKIKSSVATRSAMAAFTSDSDTGGEGPAAGPFTNIARAKNDRIVNKTRKSISSASSDVDSEMVEPPALAGTMTAVAAGHNDRISNKLRRAGSERRPLHSEDAIGGKTLVGAVATMGDDPARAKNRWIQDDLFHDEEETGAVEVDPEAYFKQRTHEVAAQRELERIDLLRQREDDKRLREEEKAGLLWDKKAAVKSKPNYGDGLVKSKGKPTAYNSQSIRNIKKLGPTKGSSYIRRDETVKGAREDHYEEPKFWDQVDKATICVGCIIVVAVLIAFITPIVLIRKKGAAHAPPSSQAREPYYSMFQDALKAVSDQDALTNSSSPQFKALNFIVYDDVFALSVDSPNLIQRYVLMVLFYATGGPVWRNAAIPWGSGVDECLWDYVECNDMVLPANATKRNLRLRQQGTARQRGLTQQVNGTVTGLHLYRAGLLKTVPNEIRQLSHLVTLDLAENRLERNTIPSVIYDLTKLKLLALENNEFSGTISPSIRNLSQLTYLSLFNNLLTGTLPTTMGLLTKLETFYAFANSPLKGPFFRYALRWTRIKSIDIANNGFTGSIPTEISRLSHLEVLGLADNSFGGTLPTSLGSLPLQVLTTSQNTRMIKGTIPTEIGRLTSIRSLLLDSGALSGTIPSELGNLRLAEHINLSQNRLHGTIPSQLGSCKSLTELDLNNNGLSGTIPTELGRISSMQTLYLEYNHMHGSAPQQVCSLRNHSLVLFRVDCSFSTGVACQVPDCCTSCEQ